MNFPEVKRAAALDHISEGWPPLSEARARVVRTACCRIVILLTLVAAVLPIYGVKVLFDSFRGTIPIALQFEVLSSLLLAPVFLLMLEMLISYCVFSKKRVPLWTVLIGLVGAYGMLINSGKYSHDISHELFDSCSGYGDFILWLAGSIALLITMIWLLDFRVLRGPSWVKIKITKGMRWIFALLLILASWLGLLYLLEIL